MGGAVAARKRHHMIDIRANANPLPQGMVVVARHMGQQRQAIGQAQGVEKLGAAKRLAHNLRLHRGQVVVHDVVGTQQHVALAVGVA